MVKGYLHLEMLFSCDTWICTDSVQLDVFHWWYDMVFCAWVFYAATFE